MEENVFFMADSVITLKAVVLCCKDWYYMKKTSNLWKTVLLYERLWSIYVDCRGIIWKAAGLYGQLGLIWKVVILCGRLC
jgi:hypothetical protein